MKLTKTSDSVKYSYGYGIRFDCPSIFSLSNFEMIGVKIFFLGVDNSSSVQIDNKKDILVPCDSLRQTLNDTTITAEAKYSINFRRSSFIYIYIIMEAKVFLFVHTAKIYIN